MNRRGFLGTLIGGVAAASAVRAWPFRVYSFPAEVVKPKLYAHISEVGTFDEITATTLADLREDILYDNFYIDTLFVDKLRRQGWAIRHSGGFA